MNNQYINSLYISNKNGVKEINSTTYSAPCIVNGGAVFDNGIKLGFCKDNNPCDGSICSTNEKLLFFTNNNWNSVYVNGIIDCCYLDIEEEMQINLDTSIYSNYNISFLKNIEVFTLKCITPLLNNSVQICELLLKNKTNNDIHINLEFDKNLYNKSENKIIIKKDDSYLLKLRVYKNEIIIE